MKYIRLFSAAEAALGKTKTPVVFYLEGAPKPMFAPTEKWGETCTIVIDDTEGSAGIKPKGFTIIFMDNEGKVISQKEYKSGDTIIVPEAPVKPGLTFLGWGDVIIGEAKNDMTYFAQYEVTPKVTLNMAEHYTDVSSIVLNATKTETVTGDISFEISLSTDYYEITDNVMVFKKHYAGDMTVTASAIDVHGKTQSDSKVISISCAGADTVVCTISDVTAADIKATDTSAVIKYKCNVTTTTHAGVSNTAVSDKSKTVTVEANATSIEVTRTGSFQCEHGETVNWSVKQAGKTAGIDGHQYVDLGIKGDDGNPLMFAACNVGASKPEEYGDYFMWGSTTRNNKSKCYWDDPNLPYHTGTSGSSGWTKYFVSNSNHITGTVDNKTVLDPEDDAAHVIMGGNWRMPTTTEFQKLAKVSNTWTTKNEIYGRKWTSGNYTLFIPAAGVRINGSLRNQGSYGYIWSSSLNASTPNNAFDLGFGSSSIYGSSSTNRYLGCSVRGVASLQD